MPKKLGTNSKAVEAKERKATEKKVLTEKLGELQLKFEVNLFQNIYLVDSARTRKGRSFVEG